ncbi:MAG: hypothetical protein H0X63_06270 [Flavobacteriales bacterium]|nr:hypothetical protein [Flavobacteriales bacterium]
MTKIAKSIINFFQKIILFIFLMMSITSAFSQGFWNIEYIPIDSLNLSLIGKEVRLDFKTSITDTIQGKVSGIRYLLLKKDTVSIVLGGKFLIFRENWKVYIDHGLLQEQTLESIENNGDERIILREMYLVSIDEATLTLEVIVYNSYGKNKESIIITKSDVKGVLLRLQR